MGRTGSRRRRRERIMNMFSLCQQMVTFFVLASSVILVLSSFTQGRSRTVPSQAAHSQRAIMEEEEARVMRSEIGSRPPRCAGRCYSCGHCEAIQVPTNPQVAKLGSGRAEVLSTTTGVNFRGDYGSNYKPMSWKCKCGNSIFNP